MFLVQTVAIIVYHMSMNINIDMMILKRIRSHEGINAIFATVLNIPYKHDQATVSDMSVNNIASIKVLGGCHSWDVIEL